MNTPGKAARLKQTCPWSKPSRDAMPVVEDSVQPLSGAALAVRLFLMAARTKLPRATPWMSWVRFDRSRLRVAFRVAGVDGELTTHC